jgi:hypothetical protein
MELSHRLRDCPRQAPLVGTETSIELAADNCT